MVNIMEKIKFLDNFNRFIALTSHSGAKISRSGDFCVDRQIEPIALHLAVNACAGY